MYTGPTGVALILIKFLNEFGAFSPVVNLRYPVFLPLALILGLAKVQITWRLRALVLVLVLAQAPMFASARPLSRARVLAAT